MYKVVIVDDEPVIVRGLTRSIEWEKWNCEVVGTAESGQEGMKLIEEKKPDILFSDICMPGIDGLSMIAALRSRYGRMQITILTGYRDFDYAQKAIRLGVTRFLLKPSKIEEIREAITAMTEKLGETEQGRPEPGEAEPAEDALAGSFIVKNALAYMEENYEQRLKLSDVAEKIYVSQWHLSKLLNRHTGQTFSELLGRIRVEKAKTLLADPSLRVGDVSEMVGFTDCAHFSRVFRKYAGVSANEYRNRIPGDAEGGQ